MSKLRNLGEEPFFLRAVILFCLFAGADATVGAQMQPQDGSPSCTPHGPSGG